MRSFDYYLNYKGLYCMGGRLFFFFDFLPIIIPKPTVFFPVYGLFYSKRPRYLKFIRIIAFLYLLFIAPIVETFKFILFVLEKRKQ